jgi:hypothetical protein
VGALEQRRPGRRPAPLLRPGLFRIPAFAAGLGVQLAFAAGMQGFFLAFALCGVLSMLLPRTAVSEETVTES